MTNSDWANKDFYKVLGVAKDASSADIKKAYRKLARDNHPDSHPGNQAAEERFKAIAEAYDVVGDPAKRKQYDELRSGLGGFGPFNAGGGAGTPPFDFNDVFGGGGRTTTAGNGGFSDLFGGMFGGGGARTTRTQTAGRRGADIETEATIGFADSIEGVTVSLRLTSDAPCPDCSGTGARAGTLPRVCPDCEGVGMRAASVGGAFTMNETCPTCRGRGLVVDDPCPTCHGSGRGMSNRTISARIPAGVKDGQRIRLRGKGAAGERGGPAGDLFVTVKVADHPLFGRKGDNLTLTVPVSFDEAALGAEIKVPTLGGAPVTLKIPPGTPNGRSFRVRGRGVKRTSGPSAGSTGDLLVTVEVQVPAVLDEKARAAVQAYRDATAGSDLRANLFDARVRPGSTS
jgi:molecular chaperone DnaJ